MAGKRKSIKLINKGKCRNSPPSHKHLLKISLYLVDFSAFLNLFENKTWSAFIGIKHIKHRSPMH